MNVLIFGAPDGSGMHLVNQALERGHCVTAFVQDRRASSARIRRCTALAVMSLRPAASPPTQPRDGGFWAAHHQVRRAEHARLRAHSIRKPGARPGFLRRGGRSAVLLEVEHLHRRRAKYAPDLGPVSLSLAVRGHGAFDLLGDCIAFRDRAVQRGPVFGSDHQKHVRIVRTPRLDGEHLIADDVSSFFSGLLLAFPSGGDPFHIVVKFAVYRSDPRHVDNRPFSVWVIIGESGSAYARETGKRLSLL